MLFGEPLVCADDSNAMVGELVMHFRDVNFLHVAGNAILPIRGARWEVICGLLATTFDVTTETNCIVSGRFRLQLLVRIVARHAGKPGVAFSPALALFQAIGL